MANNKKHCLAIQVKTNNLTQDRFVGEREAIKELTSIWEKLQQVDSSLAILHKDHLTTSVNALANFEQLTGKERIKLYIDNFWVCAGEPLWF